MNDTKRLKANELVESCGYHISLADTPDEQLFAWLEWMDYRWDGEDWL